MTETSPDTTPTEDSGDPSESWRVLMEDAYRRFHDRRLIIRPNFPPIASFAATDRMKAAPGNMQWGWGAVGEVLETINSLNAWGVRLHEWGAWNQVVDSYEDEMDRWEVLYHFLEPLASICMIQPSGFADRLALAAETVLHQANMIVDPTIRDQLDQDTLKPGQSLRRSDRKKQLKRLGKPWATFPAFRDAHAALDSDGYQEATLNFRDLSAHSFPPHLMLGQVARAVRTIVPWPELVEQPDGSFLPIEHPTKKCVQYAMQTMWPLDLAKTRAVNLAEYRKALAAFDAFSALIDELCDRMTAVAEAKVSA